MLAEFREYLKTQNVATNYYIGKIENSKLKALGIYSQPHLKRIEAIGKASSYDVAGFQLLLHWNRNARETEAAARNLYQTIRYITDTDMSNTVDQVTSTVHVDYIDLDAGEPTFIGTDDEGVYEYHISGRIFYRR